MRTPYVGARALAHVGRAAALAVAALAVLAACGSPKCSGASCGASPGRIVLRSTDVQVGGDLPARYTCDGENVSPPLMWSNVPERTRSFTIDMIDLDARKFLHWRMVAIPAGTRALATGQTPDGALLERNAFGAAGYGGPCPPSGRHRYTIEVRAMDGDGGGGAELDSGTLQVVYQRK
jgi:Raf kinase inhibitor-like YbhB/YbcL family protein